MISGWTGCGAKIRSSSLQNKLFDSPSRCSRRREICGLGARGPRVLKASFRVREFNLRWVGCQEATTLCRILSVTDHAISSPPAARSKAAEADLRKRADAVGSRLKELAAELSSKFPQFAAVANPEPSSIAEVRKALRPQEALYAIAPTRAQRPIYRFRLGDPAAILVEQRTPGTALQGLIADRLG